MGSHTLEGKVGGTTILTVTITDQGDYTVTVSGPIDHPIPGLEDIVIVTVPVIVSDGQTTTLQVILEDDSPIFTAPVTQHFVDEEGLASAATQDDPYAGDLPGIVLTASDSLNIAWGADNADNDALNGATGDRTVTFNAAQAGLASLTSNGLAVHFVLLNNGTTLVAYTGAVVPTATNSTGVVFYATLNDDNAGSYNFTLVDNLDHPTPNTEDDLNLTFAFIAKDSDGDTAGGTFTVLVDDDAPVTHLVNATATPTDDEGKGVFAALSNEGVGTGAGGSDVSGSPATVSGGTGALFQVGADGFGSVTVSGPDSLKAIWDQGGDGDAQQENVVYDALSTAADGTVTLTARGQTSGQVVFTLVIHNDGSYLFTQSAALVQSTANSEDNLNIQFNFTVTDGDGDAASNTLTVAVNDDTPVTHLVNATATPTDDEGKGVFAALSNEGVGTGAGGSDVSGSPATVSGGTGALFQVGADGFGSVTVSGPDSLKAIWDQGGDGDAQQENVVYDALSTAADGTVTLTARGQTSGQVVFTLVIHNDGSYLFTQSAALVQSTANSEDNLNIQFNFTVTDGDGDAASNTLTVAVNDDTPVTHLVNATATPTDDEGKGVFAALSNEGVGTGAGGSDVSGSPATVSGGTGALFQVGADGFGSVTVSGPDSLKAIWDQGGDGDAQQENVVYDALSTAADGTVTLTARGQTSGQVVFTLVIHNDGSYLFTQSAALVQSTANSEDNLNIQFNFTVTDGDGDAASNTLTVAVNDDTPVTHLVNATATPTDDEGKGVFAALSNEGVGTGAGGSDVSGSPATVSGGTGALFQVGADGFGSVTVSGPDSLKAIWDQGGDGDAQQENVVYDALSTAADGTVTLTARGQTSGQVVFTLVIHNDGSYLFTQSAALVQSTANSEDNLNIQFNFTVTDGDGDAASNTLTVAVNDDTPVTHLVNATATPTDDEGKGVFAALSNEGVGTGAGGSDVSGSPATVSGGTGALFQVGADGFGSVTVSGPDSLKAIWDQGGDGDAQQENVVYDALSTAADGTVTLTARGQTSGQVVFTLVIHNDGSYLFTQSAALVQSTANSEDNLNIQFNFTVTDGDGDAASNTLTVAVNDDAPVTHLVNATATPTDDEGKGVFAALSNEGVGTGAGGSDVSGSPATVSGGTGALFQVGADGFGSVTVSGPDSLKAIWDQGGDGDAQQENVVYDALSTAADGTVTLTARGQTSGQVVFTLVIHNDGSYLFTQSAALVQSTANSEDNLNIQFNFTVTDGDGDAASNTLTVAVNDDTPVTHLVNATATPTDDEGKGVFAALSNEGVGTGAGGSDVSGSPATVSGGTGALFQVGADGFGSVTVSGPDSLKAIWDQGGDGDAQQENVVYDALSTAADGTVTLTARGQTSGQVVFTLVIHNDGSYLFTQSAALVQSTANSEDNLNIQFNFTVTDGDGDAASNTLTVAVNDDTPVVHADTDSVVMGAGNIADGNVITGSGGADVNGTDGIADSAGADGFGGVAGVAAGNTGVDLVNATTVGVQITGTYGKLTLNADGSYSYDPNENIASATDVQDVFTYTMSDGDGDLAHTTLTITIAVAPFALDLPGLDDLQGNGLNKNSTLGTFASGFTYSLAEGSSPGFVLSPEGVLSTGSDNIGSGIYTLNVYNGSTTTVMNIWVGTTGNDTFNFATFANSDDSINLAYGLNGVDVITGDGGTDFIIGGQQSNTLNAGSGTTTLVAGPQGDTLTAGTGVDIFYGAGGNDTFVFDVITDSPGAGNFDTINNFTHNSDHIDLTAIAGATAVQGLVNTASTVDAHSISWFLDTANNETIVYVNTSDTANHVDMEIHLTGTNINLSGSDILHHT